MGERDHHSRHSEESPKITRNLEDRALLITGCSSGIGRTAAEGLRARGYRVFASARKPEDVDALEAERFEAVRLDLADSASIRAAVDRVLEATGGTLYGLFNNGAYGQPGAVEDLSRDALRDQFETNLFGTMELTNQVLPVMRRQGHGRIIMNSSMLGFVSMPFRGAYNASKYALEGISDTLRLELSGTCIHVVLVEPGPILSRFRANAHAAFLHHVDVDASIHRVRYRTMRGRFEAEGAVVPFTLPPEAVMNKVIRALEARYPKARYRVTVPSHVASWLKRLLPDRLLDLVLIKAG